MDSLSACVSEKIAANVYKLISLFASDYKIKLQHLVDMLRNILIQVKRIYFNRSKWCLLVYRHFVFEKMFTWSHSEIVLRYIGYCTFSGGEMSQLASVVIVAFFLKLIRKLKLKLEQFYFHDWTSSLNVVYSMGKHFEFWLGI